MAGIGFVSDVQQVFNVTLDESRRAGMADTRAATEVRSQPVELGEVEKALD
jgi:hypothetical protein